MSTRIFGRLVTDVREEDDAGAMHWKGLDGYWVTIHQNLSQTGDPVLRQLGKGRTTGPLGIFDFEFDRRSTGTGRIRVEARDPAGRKLPTGVRGNDGGIVNRPFETPDTTDEVVSVGDVFVPKLEALGLLVTNGKEEVHRHETGNGVSLLVDGDQFARAAELTKAARSEVLLTQTYFQVPDAFNSNASNEVPRMAFDFHDLNLDQPRALGTQDIRLEREMVAAALRQVPSGLLLQQVDRPWLLKLLVAALLFPLTGPFGIRWAFNGFGGSVAHVNTVKRYFQDAGVTQQVVVHGFSPSLFHAALMVADHNALCFGAPFGPGSVDSFEHRIDAWIRGEHTGLPQHSVGFEADGPIKFHLRQQIAVDAWRAADGPQLPPPADGEGPPVRELPGIVCEMQVVCTRAPDVVDDDEGEKGVLEAYQRAFAAATEFIYLENQYFASSVIADGLLDMLKLRPGLQVIMVLPITSDIGGYARKQRRLISRIRKAIGEPTTGLPRFEVFTRWTHEPPGQNRPRPRIIPVHIGSKVGVVDDIWATIGSAGLDGLSLDAAPGWFSRAFLGKDKRAWEVNATMMNSGIDSEPSVAREIRDTLWCEHLNLDALPTTLPPGGWLQVWKDRAKTTENQLKADPARAWTDKGFVLRWPDTDETYDGPAEYLRALGVPTKNLDVLRSTRAFDLKAGQWKPGKPKVDA